MDNLPHQETLVRLYELRALLDHGADLAASRLPMMPEGKCDDCAAHVLWRKGYGRVTLCHDCAVARLEVAARLTGAA